MKTLIDVDIRILRDAISDAKAEIFVRNVLNKANRKVIRKWENRIKQLEHNKLESEKWSPPENMN